MSGWCDQRGYGVAKEAVIWPESIRRMWCGQTVNSVAMDVVVLPIKTRCSQGDYGVAGKVMNNKE